MQSDSFDPDQAIHFIRPDLGPNFLQTADNTSRQRVILFACWIILHALLCCLLIFFKIKCSSGIPSNRQNEHLRLQIKSSVNASFFFLFRNLCSASFYI